MLPRFLLLAIATFAVLCSGYEDKYSCDFNGSWCLWFQKHISDNCQWKLSNEVFNGKKGYAVLDGENPCMAQLRWGFLWFPINPKMITFEYYVTGPGPYALNVTSEKSYKPEWSCKIQPGDQKRVGHAAPIRQSNILIISGYVAPGSQIIIPQVWKGLQGHKVEYTCPASISENTIKPHNITVHVPHTTKPEVSTVKTVTRKSLNSTTESSSIFMKYLISLKGKLAGLIRNITLSVKIDYNDDKKNLSQLSSFYPKK